MGYNGFHGWLARADCVRPLLGLASHVAHGMQAIQVAGLPKDAASAVRKGVREMTKKGLHAAILVGGAKQGRERMGQQGLA